MQDPLKEVNKLASTVTSAIDDNLESEQERQATLTERLKLDTTSPFKLPHLIRPIAFIWAMALQTILSLIVVILAFKSKPVDTMSIMVVVGSQGAILTTIVGFYFSSRKQEKITQTKVNAAIKLKEIETKAEIKANRKENRRGLFKGKK